jgi:carboxymethylenebutenolidase
MTESTVPVPTPDGPMQAFQALPSPGAPAPGVVVLQEAFGVNAHIRDVCKRLAAEGYAALAPELYHRTASGVAVDYSDMPAARRHLAEVTNDSLTTDVRAGFSHLRGLAGVDPGRVGVLGFCMGGFTAFLAACRTDTAATVAFYGGGIVRPRPGLKLVPLLEEAGSIDAPLLCIFGETDTAIPPEDVEAIRSRLQALGKVHEVVVYPEAGHGFLCSDRASYHEAAAVEAWARTLEWLGRHLRG